VLHRLLVSTSALGSNTPDLVEKGFVCLIVKVSTELRNNVGILFGVDSMLRWGHVGCGAWQTSDYSNGWYGQYE